MPYNQYKSQEKYVKFIQNHKYTYLLHIIYIIQKSIIFTNQNLDISAIVVYNYIVNIYQINIRQLLYSYGKDATLNNIPSTFWVELQKMNINCVYLLGIWQLPIHSITQKYAAQPPLIKEYEAAVGSKKWEDVICGSIFAIDRYEVDEHVGTLEELLMLKRYLNSLNITLMLDFIPNHFHIESSTLELHDEVFLSAPLSNQDTFESDEYIIHNEKCIARGKDPHFAPWIDTAQVNYSSEYAQDFMIDQLLKVSSWCDGLRVDMSMLMERSVFSSTWQKWGVGEMPNEEFWSRAIRIVKTEHPEIILLAETYWNTEDSMLERGFDLVYYKPWLDAIKKGDIEQLTHIENEVLKSKYVLFLENHDEDRIAKDYQNTELFYITKAFCNMNSPKLIQHGQQFGETKKIPVQLRASYASYVTNWLSDTYIKNLEHK